MKLTQMFLKTYRDAPADAEIKSHKLLVRAGYMKKQSAGTYIYMPLAIKVINKIENVIREELDKVGCVELQMPMLLTQDVYAGRIEKFGNDMFKLKDRNNKDYCLAPTHEEIFTQTVKDYVTSYKQLPVVLYQIQTKFRDEVRPRFGLIRAKEFIMKDAYSYDIDKEGLNRTFQLMSDTYDRIFERLGLDFVSVEADNGAMGGSGSREFMVKNDIGEDEIMVCEHCRYAANVEKAPCVFEEVKSTEKHMSKELVKTPSVKTIKELVDFLKVSEDKFLKVVAYACDNGVVLALVRGDREVEEVKLSNLVNSIKFEMASHEDIANTGSVAGFIGATPELKNVYVVADNEVKNMVNFVMGGNKEDYHYINANLEDLKVDKFADIRKCVAGDKCPKCGKPMITIRGIEVGHIFKNDTHYTELLDCKYLDENGKQKLMEMGCYGIGVTRTLSALVEQYSDDHGIVWPNIVAPYKVHLVVTNAKDEEMMARANDVYAKLQADGFDVLYDDRKESFGVKLKDAELLGMPYIVIVGRDSDKGLYEFVERKNLEKQVKSYEEIIQFLKK